MQNALVAMSPPTPRHYVPPPGGRPDRPKSPNMMGAFAYHPDLAQAFFSFNGHALYGTTLSLRQRELLVLRIAAVRESPYLWAHHLVYKDEASLTDDDIAAIGFGPNAPFLDPLDQALMQSVDELIVKGRISDETWNALAAKLNTQQILDVIFTIGCYDIVARVGDSLQLDLDIGPQGGG
jgi:alkylhydroperoxidase family enzyme